MITEQDLALAERLDATAFIGTVSRTDELTPLLRSITLEAPELAEFSCKPGQDVMVAVGDRTDDVRAGGVIRRRYTIRRHNPSTATLELNIVTHGDGPGALWARTAEVSSTVSVIGPRGKVMVDEAAAWHCFVGDEAFWPAALAMAESVAAGTPVIVVLETEAGATLETPVAVQWVTRPSDEAGESKYLLEALASLDLPEGVGHAYVGGEFSVVRAIHDLLIAKGIGEEQLSVKPYWRRGRSNAPHGEPEKGQ